MICDVTHYWYAYILCSCKNHVTKKTLHGECYGTGSTKKVAIKFKTNVRHFETGYLTYKNVYYLFNCWKSRLGGIWDHPKVI